jgi:hypothetical protein
MQKARSHYTNVAPTVRMQMVSGSIALRCWRFFSPFPHGTGSLSVFQEYLALPDGAGTFSQDFTGLVILWILLDSNTISCTGISPSVSYLSKYVPL